MDKYEYKLRSDEIVKLIEEEKYVEAANIADMIDWFCTLCVKCRLSWMM